MEDSHSSHSGQPSMSVDYREPTTLFLRPLENVTAPVPPLSPRPSRSRRSQLNQLGPGGPNVPSWVSVNSLPPPPIPQRDTLTASPVSTIRPGQDLDERTTEYMTVDPDADFNVGDLLPSSTIVPDDPSTSAKQGFVGGFVKRLRSFPRTVLKGASVINPFTDRKPSKKGTGGTGDSLPKYTETTEPFLPGGDFGAGPAIEIFAPSPEAQFVQAIAMPVAHTIPEESEHGPEDRPPSVPSQHGSIHADPQGPYPSPRSPIPSVHPLDGETTAIPQEIHPSVVADMSPETVYPAPASDYDRMEYRMRTPSEASFVTYLGRIVQICHYIYELPWITTTRVVRDYVPERSTRARLHYRGSTRLKQVWYPSDGYKSQSILDLSADPPPNRRKRRRARDRTSSSIVSSLTARHTSHQPTPRRSTTTRPGRRTDTGIMQPSSRYRRSSGVQTETPRSSHSYANSHSHRSCSPAHARGYPHNFNFAFAPPQPLYISPGPNPVPPGWPWCGTPTQQAAMPLFLLATSPTGALATLPVQNPSSVEANPGSTQSNSSPPPAAAAATSP